MKIGLLFVNNGHQDMYLPIFHEDREFVLSVLTDAMKKWEANERKSFRKASIEFFEIVDDLGRERSRSQRFLGSEAASEQSLGGVEYACKNALYVFSADFEAKKIVTLK
jgi:hypothetical protein